jgi:hypothetical protein
MLLTSIGGRKEIAILKNKIQYNLPRKQILKYLNYFFKKPKKDKKLTHDPAQKR